jgi:hypothetical protein
VVVVLFNVAVHKSRTPERTQGLGLYLGLAGWTFFVYLFGLRKVRPHRAFIRRHRSAPAGNIFTDKTSTVSDSAIADRVDAGMLQSIFFGVLFKRKKTPQKTIKTVFLCFIQT